MNNDHGFWRSLAEYHREGELDVEASPEFAEPLDPPTSRERRRFMQLMGASIALAGTSGCRWKEDKLVPFVQRPEDFVPGEARQFMTAMELGDTGVGLSVRSFDGRPIKVDGNPQHPDSLGATKAVHQASILTLYDPDRQNGVSRRVGDRLQPATDVDFRIFAKDHFVSLGARRGSGLYVLSGASASRARADMKRRFLEAFPEARWLTYEPISQSNVERGSVLAFGAPLRTHLKLDAARIIVSLGADLFADRGR